MKYLITLITLISLNVNAQVYKDGNGKELTKTEALLTLAKNPNAIVVKCQQQELSDKATIRNKKETKKEKK